MLPGVWLPPPPPAPPELVRELDRLPFPDREFFSPPGSEATVMASRGCPFSCRYCCNHALRALASRPGDYVRFIPLIMCWRKSPHCAGVIRHSPR
ncbi:MAG TPA: hypothetical protein PKM88_09090 [bacterium]|nr:hypothetical protein [bacterium]